MYCSKCHKKLNNNNICENCGIDNNDNKIGSFSTKGMNLKNIYEENNDSKNFNNLNEKSNGEYLTAYMNIKEEDLNRHFISIPTLLFGPFYYLYKKIWSYGIIYLILYIITNLIPNTNISLISKIVINIILSLLFNKQYIEYAKYEVKTILNYKENKSNKEIIEICRKKGKNLNIIFIVIIIISYILITIHNNNFFNKIQKNDNNENNTIKNMNYKIPNKFKIITEEDNYKFYTYKENNSLCYISITTSNKYDSAINYLREITKSDENYKKDDYDTKKINNYEWTKIYMEKETSIKEYFATKYKEDIYEINFESISDNNNDTCKKYKNDILNKVKFN